MYVLPSHVLLNGTLTVGDIVPGNILPANVGECFSGGILIFPFETFKCLLPTFERLYRKRQLNN
jgi:hypothetical protein